MITNEYLLELSNVFHTGNVEPGTCFQKLVGSVPTGIILKDVSLEVHGGEVMAVLGSKGSGKKALLDVISRRAQGPTRGQLLLNSVPMSMRLFQESCAFVASKTDFISGLTVHQTMSYAGELTVGRKVSSSVKKNRVATLRMMDGKYETATDKFSSKYTKMKYEVKQVMADLALTQVANHEVDSLTPSEHKRLAIGVQIMRDPVVILLEEPNIGLDPLNTYFIISILSNHAKKYNRIVILTMEKPRSDIFPFLDRVTYLCLGDVVYSGNTRMMLDYFRSVGYPCPELENPLMYYLCLSTVDRRSRERYIESSSHIESLVEKFKTEGANYQKYTGPAADSDNMTYKVPLTAYGSPSTFKVFLVLIMRAFQMMLNCNKSSAKLWLMKLFAVPIYFTLIFLFYFELKDTQQSFIARNGLLLNSLVAISFLSAAITSVTFASHRTRYYQENREGLYNGPTFVLAHVFYNLPVSLVSIFGASAILYTGTGLNPTWTAYVAFAAVLWTVYSFVELQTMTIMMFVKSSFNAFISSIYVALVYIILASGTVRSIYGLPSWLYYVSFGTIYRYAGGFLNENEFAGRLENLQSVANDSLIIPCQVTGSGNGCRYLDGTHYLSERYHYGKNMYYVDLVYNRNLYVCFIFYAGMIFVNIIAYLIPLPSFIKSKFRG